MPTDAVDERPAHSHETGSVVAVSAVVALLVGAAAAVQGAMNGKVSTTLGYPALAALWSFGSGYTVLLAFVALSPKVRRGLREVVAAVRARHLQWWELVGGLMGGFLVGVQAAAIPALGVALFTIALVGGQTTNALVVDRLGLGPGGRADVTLGRVAAALLTFVGVVVASTARSGGGHGLSVLHVVLAVLAGAGLAVQQAINGKVNLASGHPLATATINFTWGTAAIITWTLVLWLRGAVHAPESWHVPPWALFSGVIGLTYIAAAAVIVRHLGVLVTALLTLTGQLVMAVVLDLLTGAAPVSAQLVLGVAITLAAALGAGIAAGRAARTRIPTKPAQPRRNNSSTERMSS